MDYAAARQHMIESQIRTNKVTDSAVITALAGLPRELFVADSHRKLAYIDRPVPMAAGRRMMEPMYLARLLQVAELQPEAKALVVGAGTGYAVVPHSIARLHQRRDVVAVPITDAEPTRIALAWLNDPRPARTADDQHRIDTFIGIVRGRTVNSSRT